LKMASGHEFSPRSVRLEPLTRERFAPYGDLIEAGAGRASLVNDGRATRYDGVTALSNSTGIQEPSLSVYHVRPSEPPFAASVFERHPHSGQIFLPMAEVDFPVIVAPDREGTPDVARAEAFLSPRSAGIHYRAGVWHVPLAVFGREATFFMLMWETGTQDTLEHRLSVPLIIHP
jgi:ureidoglycolate lyase